MGRGSKTSLKEAALLLIGAILVITKILKIKRLLVDDFKLLINILDKECGGFLCKCSQQITHFLNLLSGPIPERKCMPEDTDESLVKEEPFDSPGLIEYLELDG